MSDLNIFSRIDETGAYILGLLWSDGCLYQSPDSKSGWRLHLGMKDKDHISRVCNLITQGERKPTRQIRHKSNDIWVFRTTDYSIIKSVRARGLIPRKSHDINWPIGIRKKYESDFIRGVFDGDGCAMVNKKTNTKGKIYSYLSVSITGSQSPFMDQLFSKLVHFSPRWYTYPNGRWRKIMIYGKDNVRQFAKYIYQSRSSFVLERKYQQFKTHGYIVKKEAANG